MANHKSSLKRIRSNEVRRIRNKYQHKTTRNAVRDLRAMTVKADAEAKLVEVISMLDKIAKNNIIHKNKAANLKSKLTKFVATLA
jgi:small subunit ribosomal protein S20